MEEFNSTVLTIKAKIQEMFFVWVRGSNSKSGWKKGTINTNVMYIFTGAENCFEHLGIGVDVDTMALIPQVKEDKFVVKDLDLNEWMSFVDERAEGIGEFTLKGRCHAGGILLSFLKEQARKVKKTQQNHELHTDRRHHCGEAAGQSAALQGRPKCQEEN